MSIYIEIFKTFFILGFVSFGGGYAMIPLIQGQIEAHGWLNTTQFTDVIAVSAMAPGPIATNSATIVGFRISDFLGAIVACIGVTLPSVILIVLVGRLFFKYQENNIVKAAFYGIRAVVVGLIAYTAIKFAINNGIVGGENVVDVKSLVILVVMLVLLFRNKVHPAFLILASAGAGILIF